MRIALISPLFESVPPRLYGGTERVVANLCRGLTAAGHELTLFASGDSQIGHHCSSSIELVAPVAEALRLRPEPVQDPAAYHIALLSAVARRGDEFDVIHNHHDYWMLPLAKMTRVPLVTTLHGRLDLKDIPAALGAFEEASFVSISDHQRLPLPDLNWVRTIHHGMDIKPIPFRDQPGKYLAFLGRIDAQKRPDLAIEVAKKAGVPLKIAAKIEGRESQDFFDAYVKPHIDGKFIEFVGEVDEAQKYEFLGGALATVFPIDWPEPFGLVMIESLACGTPVLARPFGSVPEILKDGVTGFIDANVATLAQRISEISRISRRACRKWVEDRFSLERMTEDYIHVYKRLIESTSARERARKKIQWSDRHRWDLVHSFERSAHRNS